MNSFFIILGIVIPLLALGDPTEGTAAGSSLRAKGGRFSRGAADEAEIFREAGSSRSSNPNPEGSQTAEAFDIKSVQEIQSDMQLLSKAGSNLQNLVTQINGILGTGTSSKYADFTHHANKGTGYFGAPGFVKFYKNSHGWQGYPRTAVGLPCASAQVVNSLPTFPVLIKRITADTTYLVDLFSKGYGTSVVGTAGHGYGISTGVVGSTYDGHYH